jgi:hypothetical protein
MATADELRRQGRADAVVLLYIRLSRSLPSLSLEEFASWADVPPMYIKPAIIRLRLHRPAALAAARPNDPAGKKCRDCGKPVFQPVRPGKPRELCDDCAPHRRRYESRLAASG